jgi:hypothetical protein
MVAIGKPPPRNPHRRALHDATQLIPLERDDVSECLLLDERCPVPGQTNPVQDTE